MTTECVCRWWSQVLDIVADKSTMLLKGWCHEVRSAQTTVYMGIVHSYWLVHED